MLSLGLGVRLGGREERFKDEVGVFGVSPGLVKTLELKDSVLDRILFRIFAGERFSHA